MKTKLVAAIAVLAIGITAITYQGVAQGTGITPPPSGQGNPQPAAKNRHPAIRAAIRALQNAKTDMQNAAHDFGGHRVDAIAACDTAIAQLNLALQYANANSSGTSQQ
jgi:hypothetical protein